MIITGLEGVPSWEKQHAAHTARAARKAPSSHCRKGPSAFIKRERKIHSHLDPAWVPEVTWFMWISERCRIRASPPSVLWTVPTQGTRSDWQCGAKSSVTVYYLQVKVNTWGSFNSAIGHSFKSGSLYHTHPDFLPLPDSKWSALNRAPLWASSDHCRDNQKPLPRLESALHPLLNHILPLTPRPLLIKTPLACLGRGGLGEEEDACCPQMCPIHLDMEGDEGEGGVSSSRN